MYVCMYIHIHIHKYIHIYINIYITYHLWVYNWPIHKRIVTIHVYICIHSYMFTHIHIHISPMSKPMAHEPKGSSLHNFTSPPPLGSSHQSITGKISQKSACHPISYLKSPYNWLLRKSTCASPNQINRATLICVALLCRVTLTFTGGGQYFLAPFSVGDHLPVGTHTSRKVGG